MMNDRLFFVTMEYLPEARHNPEFRQRIIPVVQEFHGGLNAVWAELAQRVGVEPEDALIPMNATMCLIRGMIAHRAVRDDPPYFSALLKFWKAQMRREFKQMTDAHRIAATSPEGRAATHGGRSTARAGRVRRG